MKIKNLRFANAILVGNTTLTFIESKAYDIKLDGVLIWITCKRTGQKSFTSLFNVPYGVAEEENASNQGSGNSERGSKKASK